MNDAAIPAAKDTPAEQTPTEPPAGQSTGTAARDDGRPLQGVRAWLSTVTGGRRPNAREDLVDALATDVDGFTAAEREMLANILKLREQGVEDIMVPRADIDAVEIESSLSDLLTTFHDSGHSRMPVFRESLDDPLGFVHIKDLMRYAMDAAPHQDDGEDEANSAPAGSRATLGGVDLGQKLADTDLVRDILFVPPSMSVAMLLANMQSSRVQMALVIDEYGGTDGLVSLEDAIEAVVGDIADEHDDETVAMVVADGDRGFLADARAPLEEVIETIAFDLTEGTDAEDAETIGGLVFSLLGRVPVRGELVTAPSGVEFEILDADPRRIKRLRISRRRTGRRDARRNRRRPVVPGDSAT